MPTDSRPKAQSLQWEYRIITSKDGLHVAVESAPGGEETTVLLDDYMTRIGTLGWELVTAYPTDLGHNFVFKRKFRAALSESERPQ